MPADLAAVRRMALALPRTEERPSYNDTAGFRVRSRGLFVREREDGETIALKIDYGERRALTAMQPETFEVTPHYENYPWVVVHLGRVDPDELEELIIEAWRLTASKTAVKAFDSENSA